VDRVENEQVGTAPQPAAAVRAPARVLGGALLALGTVALLSVALISAADLDSGKPGELARLALPAVLGFPAVALVWRAVRRTVVPWTAWLATGVGLAVLLAVTVAPSAALVETTYLQWQQYQPGGQGYQP
jgi:peptidoglycan/LPS O-acetylase OafA/YrhL